MIVKFSNKILYKIEGSAQKLISSEASTKTSIGNRYQAECKDEVMAQEIAHIVTVPKNPQSGQPSGQRTHKPFLLILSMRLSPSSIMHSQA